jgi:CBS domain-containing protein
MDDESAAAVPSLAGPVSDIMQREVTTVPPDMSVRELTRVLSDRSISGAPVTDADGVLLGVVSSSDVMRFTAEAPDTPMGRLTFLNRRTPDWPTDEDDPPAEDPIYGDYFLPEEGPTVMPTFGDDLAHGPLDETTVEDIMTPVSFAVEPTTSVQELASFLLRGRIHRAVVTEDGRCVGIVTTTDILRAVAAPEAG